MNRLLVILCVFLFSNLLLAQGTISLETCYQKAIENYPLTRQKELNDASKQANLQRIDKDNLPQLNLNSQVHYQSDVTKIPIQGLPGVEQLSKDWYKFNLDLNQNIYSGGMTSRQKAIAEADYAINQQSLQVELFKLKNRINQLFFSIIILEQNLKILETHQNTIHDKLSNLEAGQKNGIVLTSNVDILRAELIQLEQSMDEVKISRQASLSMLSEYTGLDLSVESQLEVPGVEIETTSITNNRPELSLFSLQQEKIKASENLIGAKNLPHVSAFGQLGYGRPGFDMLENTFTDYYIVGARLNWHFYDWNRSKKEKEVLAIQSDLLETQKETFQLQVNIDLKNKRAKIQKLEHLLKRDQEIIQLRQNIVKSVSAQLDNGIITSTDYVTQLNAESKARLDLEVHRIELIQAKVDYRATLGNL